MTATVPKVAPEGAVNFEILGQLAESHPKDVIFTVEYSARTAMEAVYTLLDIEKGVPEPWGSMYDVRALLNAGIVLRDGEKCEAARPDRRRWSNISPALKDLEKTEIGELLRDYGWIGELGDNELSPAPKGHRAQEGACHRRWHRRLRNAAS